MWWQVAGTDATSPVPQEIQFICSVELAVFSLVIQLQVLLCICLVYHVATPSGAGLVCPSPPRPLDDLIGIGLWALKQTYRQMTDFR